MKCRFGLAIIAATVALAGCVTTRPRAPLAPHTKIAHRHGKASQPRIEAPQSAPAAAKARPARNFWDDLRAHLRMHDCAADSRIHAWAHRYTRWPRSFEAQLKNAMPVIGYIEQAAVDHEVPTEFVFLPWVESHYRSIAPRHGRAAGMWQIMPVTARTLQLPVTTGYDARLDKVAATAAVMRLLSRYHATFHDWRLVDMAFNAGKYRLLHATDNHTVPDTPGIPDVDVPRGTRLHLAKLMAMACIVRHPQRYGVTLPEPDASRTLEEVDVDVPMNMATVARLSSLPLRRVRELNGAYLHGRMPAGAPHHVLLPDSGITAFKATFAVLGGILIHINTSTSPPPPSRYTVASGDSLWSIARRFGTTVRQLEHWNHLQDARLHPGQTLRLEPAYR